MTDKNTQEMLQEMRIEQAFGIYVIKSGGDQNREDVRPVKMIAMSAWTH